MDDKFKLSDALISEIKNKLSEINDRDLATKQHLKDLSKEVSVMQANIVANSQSDIITKNDMFKKFEAISYKLSAMAKTFEENTFITAPLVRNNVNSDGNRLK